MNTRISEAQIYEIYVDLWGLTPAWIERIQSAVLEAARNGDGEEAEGYTCPACMAVRFRTLDPARIPTVRGIVSRLLNFAKPSAVEDSDSVVYWGAV